MMSRWSIVLFLVFLCSAGLSYASVGDSDLLYRSCVNQCSNSGCIGENCFPQCNLSSTGGSVPWYIQEPLYLKWQQLECLSDCRYYCMVDREGKRQLLGHDPVKYHGKWPFKRVFRLQFIFSGTFFCGSVYSQPPNAFP
ncbi:Post-GPI attachment to proteins factor 3 [Bienertia sinuspersici]